MPSFLTRIVRPYLSIPLEGLVRVEVPAGTQDQFRCFLSDRPTNETKAAAMAAARFREDLPRLPRGRHWLAQLMTGAAACRRQGRRPRQARRVQRPQGQHDDLAGLPGAGLGESCHRRPPAAWNGGGAPRRLAGQMVPPASDPGTPIRRRSGKIRGHVNAAVSSRHNMSAYNPRMAAVSARLSGWPAADNAHGQIVLGPVYNHSRRPIHKPAKL
jgi:hypothetical protein